jgi:hypothetical protein
MEIYPPVITIHGDLFTLVEATPPTHTHKREEKKRERDIILFSSAAAFLLVRAKRTLRKLVSISA